MTSAAPGTTRDKWSPRLLGLLVGLVLAACLAYGTSGPLARPAVAASILLLTATTLLVQHRSRLGTRKTPGLIWAWLLVGFGALQLVPLHPVVIELLSPATAAWYRKSVWLQSPGGWRPLSLHPGGTAEFLGHLAMAFGCYWLTCQLVATKTRLNRVVLTLAGFGSIYALLSIFESVFPNGRILWVLAPWPARAERQIGTFVNPNHFAGWVGMLLPLFLAKYYIYRPSLGWGHWRDRLLDLFDGGRFSRTLLYAVVCLLLATVIVLSQSRGGFLSSLAAIAVFIVGLASERRSAGRVLLIPLLLLLAAFIIGWFGWAPLLSRFFPLLDRGMAAEQRLDYWVDSLAILRDFPLVGTGFGTFADVYGAYQSVSTGQNLVDHAHNDGVEFLVEGGLVGAVLLGGLIASVAISSLRGFSRRRSRPTRVLVWGVFAGLAAGGFHSLFDFGLRLGAPALLFALLAGLLVVATHLSTGARTDAFELPIRPPAATGVVMAVLVFLAGAGVWQVARFTGNQLGQGVRAGIDGGTEGAALAARVGNLQSLDPLAAEWRALAGELKLADGDAAGALAEYRTGNLLRPLNGVVLQRLGELLIQRGELENGFALVRTGAEVEKMFPDGWRNYARLLAAAGSSECLVAYRRALTLEPRKARDYLATLILAGMNDEQLQQVLPDLPFPWVAYGDYQLSRRRDREAEQSYRRAVALTLTAGEPDGLPFQRFGDYLVSRNRLPEAVEVLHQGMTELPQHTGLALQYARYCESAGLMREAVDGYRRVINLSPGHAEAVRRLAALKKDWNTL